ncbi:MAG: PspC domain-containing protein [Bacteroidota bacterium]
MAPNHLYRSVKDRKIAGVAGGIAEYLKVDSAAVRLIWLLAILFGGAGFLVYLIAWIVIPEERESLDQTDAGKIPNPAVGKTELTGGMNFWGILLITLGGILLLKQFVPFELTKYFWPVIIISLGIFLLLPRK